MASQEHNEVISSSIRYLRMPLCRKDLMTYGTG